MFEKTYGIVLHALRYGEDSMVVDVLTQTRGTVSFMVKLPRSRKSNVKSRLLSPLNILEIDMDFRPGKSLQRMRDLQLSYPYDSIPYEPMKELMALFLGEVLYHALKYEDRNDRLFTFLLHSLRWFDGVQSDYVNFHLTLLIKLTRYLGFWPNTEYQDASCFFDLQEGAFTPFRPLHGHCLDAGEAAWVSRFLRMNYATMRRFKMNREQRNYVLDKLCLYYRLHVPEFPALKSLEVLREVVDNG